MKLPFTLASLLVLSLMLTPTVTGQKVCSCNSLCAATVSCSRRGCTAICDNKDGCYSACGNDLLVTRFNLKLDGKSGKEVAFALSDHTGHKIEFTPFPRKGNPVFDVDIKNADMWNTMDRLSKHGTLTVDEVPWKKYQTIRSAALAGNKLSVQFNDISVGDALAHLSFLTGLAFEADPGGAGKTVSLTLPNVTLKEIISRIRAQTGVRVKRTEKRASMR